MISRPAIGAVLLVLGACKSKAPPAKHEESGSAPATPDALAIAPGSATSAPGSNAIAPGSAMSGPGSNAAAPGSAAAGGSAREPWFCATFAREGGDPGDRTRCERTQAQCEQTAAAEGARVASACTPSTATPICYSSSVSGSPPITTCYATVADCSQARTQETEHNRQGPTLSDCMEAN